MLPGIAAAFIRRAAAAGSVSGGITRRSQRPTVQQSRISLSGCCSVNQPTWTVCPATGTLCGMTGQWVGFTVTWGIRPQGSSRAAASGGSSASRPRE
ncbi:hypothetical protein ADK54_34575 [Streptomyces sp. WM6378]|nr:hypothetical protein ADK54_34575 [Streptomyces sp. WM6378]